MEEVLAIHSVQDAVETIKDRAWDIAEIVDPTGVAAFIRFLQDHPETCKYPSGPSSQSIDELIGLADVDCWMEPIRGAIVGNNLSCHDGKSLDQCKAMCEADDRCKSLDYKWKENHCCLGTCRVGDGRCSNGHPGSSEWQYVDNTCRQSEEYEAEYEAEEMMAFEELETYSIFTVFQMQHAVQFFALVGILSLVYYASQCTKAALLSEQRNYQSIIHPEEC